MLLYITAEDVFGDGAPERKGPEPLHRIPETLAGLYDLGLRHHVREAAMRWPEGDGLQPVPDWKLDRLAIRLALYGRERLGVEPGERVAVVGPLGRLWPVVDFAAMGFGAIPVGIEHDVSDEDLRRVVAEARPRVVFATDPESTARVSRLATDGVLGEATIVGEGLEEGERALPLERLLELGSIMDTAERAQAFRAVSRQISPGSVALWHVGHGGPTRLTHAEAMRIVEPALRSRPAQPGDVAYVAGPRVALGTRLALAAFVGDGHTTTVLGRLAQMDEDIQELKPHKMLLSGGEWLEATCRDQGPRWPGRLDRPWAGRRLLDRLGGRLRWVEAPSAVGETIARALDAAGVTLHTSTNVTVH